MSLPQIWNTLYEGKIPKPAVPGRRRFGTVAEARAWRSEERIRLGLDPPPPKAVPTPDPLPTQEPEDLVLSAAAEIARARQAGHVVSPEFEARMLAEAESRKGEGDQ